MSDLPQVAEVADQIDHAILKPELTTEQVDAELELAAKYNIFSVCVRPSDVPRVTRYLADTTVATGTVIGFPHGTTSTVAKVAESEQALSDGAQELDMVVNIGRLRSGLLADVEADIAAVVGTARGKIVKVILETAYLNDGQIVDACRASEAAGANFVKTSTGFAGGGATLEAVTLMRASVSGSVQVKASGGVRGLDTLLQMRQAGVTRFGTSATAAILDDLSVRLTGGIGTGAIDSSSY